MAKNSFIQISKLPDVVGRIDYITNPERQEYLYEVTSTTDEKYWRELAKCNQDEFKKSGTKGRCIEARELIIAIPQVIADEIDKQKMIGEMAWRFKSAYGVECIAAIHHNKTKTNLHVHMIFSERKLRENPEVKIASRNMFYDESGKHVRTKKEILDQNGNLKQGCTIIKKGEVYETNRFENKNSYFKSANFLDEVKHMYTDYLNSYLDQKDKMKVFDNNDVYLPTKKVGKNNPQTKSIIKTNAKRTEWNKAVDKALEMNIPKAYIKLVKYNQIIVPMKLHSKMNHSRAYYKKHGNKGNDYKKSRNHTNRKKTMYDLNMMCDTIELFIDSLEMAIHFLGKVVSLFVNALTPKTVTPQWSLKELNASSRYIEKRHCEIESLYGKINSLEYKLDGKVFGKKKIMEEIEILKLQIHNERTKIHSELSKYKITDERELGHLITVARIVEDNNQKTISKAKENRRKLDADLEDLTIEMKKQNAYTVKEASKKAQRRDEKYVDKDREIPVRRR